MPRFIVFMLVADIVAAVAFTLFTKGWIAIVAGLAATSLKLRGKAQTATDMLLILVGFGAQVWFWTLWAAVCTFAARYYSETSSIPAWVFWIAAFGFAHAPFVYVALKERASHSEQTDARGFGRGVRLFQAIISLAFLCAAIWPSAGSTVHGWLLRLLGLV